MHRSYLDEIHDLFERYYEDKKNPEKDASSLRKEIDELVLTGEQILESGITDFSEVHSKYESDIEELERNVEKRKEIYKTLKELYQKLKNEKAGENNVKYKGLKDKKVDALKTDKLAKIEKIIQGKQGTIIDDIRDAIG